MSTIPNLPKDPVKGHRHYNFRWNGENWVNMSNNGAMVISDTPPELIKDNAFWFEPARETLHFQQKNLWGDFDEGKRGENRWVPGIGGI